MKKDVKQNAGIQLLLKRYKDIFRIPENTDYYSKTDYKIAEKRFLRHALLEGNVEIQQELQEVNQHSNPMLP